MEFLTHVSADFQPKHDMILSLASRTIDHADEEVRVNAELPSHSFHQRIAGLFV
jgi:hypothetical protein